MSKVVFPLAIRIAVERDNVPFPFDTIEIRVSDIKSNILDRINKFHLETSLDIEYLILDPIEFLVMSRTNSLDDQGNTIFGYPFVVAHGNMLIDSSNCGNLINQYMKKYRIYETKH